MSDIPLHDTDALIAHAFNVAGLRMLVLDDVMVNGTRTRVAVTFDEEFVRSYREARP